MPTAGEYQFMPTIAPNATELGAGVFGTPEAELGPTLTQCQQILTSVEQALRDNIQGCLNECHGSLGVCHACVLGNLERDLARVGSAVAACSERLLRDAGGTMRELWGAAFGAGVPAPTDAQLSAALAGQPIPEPAESGEPAADVFAVDPAVLAAGAALADDAIGMSKPVIATCPAPFLADVLGDGSEVWVFSQPIYDAAGNYLRCDTRSSVLPPGTQVTGGPTPDQVPPLPSPIDGGGPVPPVPLPEPGQPVPTLPGGNGNVPGGVPAPIYTGPIQTPPTYPLPPQTTPVLASGGPTASEYSGMPGMIANLFPPRPAPTTPPPPQEPTSGLPPAPPPVQPPPPPGNGFGQTYVIANPPDDCVPPRLYSSDTSQILAAGTPIGDGSFVLAGPFGTGTDGGQAALSWINQNPGTVGQYWKPDQCSGTPPPAPSPPPVTCPTCGAGFHWGVDANGNPTCIRDCSCPPPPAGPPPTTPPSDGEKPPGPPVEFKPHGISFCDPATAQTISQTLELIGSQGDPDKLREVVLGLTGGNREEARTFLQTLRDELDSSGFFTKLFTGVITAAGTIVSKIAAPILTADDPGGCNSRAFGEFSLANAMVGLLNHFGMTAPATIASYRNTLNYLCQWHIPSTQELTAAWARGWLEPEEWDYGVKLNGDCLPWQKKLRELARVRIGITDAYRLWKLDKIDSDEFKRALIEQGVDWERDQGFWGDAVQQYPGMQDLVRMMMRDVEDPAVIERFKLDAEFDDKWTGTLKQWGAAQGVPDDVALRYWRAHWQAPSPQQIFEWVHRLRGDDRDPNDPFAQVTVTLDDARKFLQIADYVPGLIDAYVATSYRPFTRVDIRRMWRVGVFTTKAEVRRAYRDLGSDQGHAEKLADFTVKTEAAARAKFLGKTGEADVTRALVRGLISEDEARTLYQEAGLEAEQTEARIKAAGIRADIDDRNRVRESLRKRFFMGEFTAGQLQGELSAAGVPTDTVSRLARVWQAERNARQKHPTIDMLCKWWMRNLITLDDFFTRVRNLNYPERDALLVVQNCQIGLQELRQKELERETKRVEQAAKTRAKEAAAAARLARPYTVVKPRVSIGTQRRHTESTTRTNGSVKTTVVDTLTDQQTEPPTPPPIVP